MEQLKTKQIQTNALLKQKQINELIQTIKALDLIGAVSTIQRHHLQTLFSSKTQ